MIDRRKKSLLAETQRFATALDHAIYDKQVEADSKLLYLYDADVVVYTVLGLTEWKPTQALPDVSELMYVVRALLSVGYIPRAHLLRPHLIELDRFIQRVPQPDRREANSRIRMFQFLAKQWQLDKHDSRIKEYAANRAALQTVIRSEGFEIFVKLELCHGGLAYDRLARVIPHCSLRSPELAQLPMRPGDHFAHEVAEVVGRAPGRQQKPVNNLVDGYALSELAEHVAAGVPVRFYTETESLRRLGRGVRLRDRAGRSVVRDAAYFLMRSSFPALAFSHLRASSHTATEVADRTLDDLIRLNERLRALLSPEVSIDRRELERAIRNEQGWGTGETLADLIHDFYSLRFLKDVLLSRWRFPAAMRDFVPFLANFFSNGERIAQVRAALGRSLTSVTSALSEEIGQIARWQSDVREFRREIEARRGDFDGRAPDPWRDLGLGRWGLDVFLPERVRTELEAWIREIADEDGPIDRLASDVALRAAPDSYRGWEDFALAQCQLWTLKLYGRMLTEWEESGDRFDGEGMQVLRILYLVARIKTVAAGFRAEGAAEIRRIQDVVREAETTLVALSESEDRRLRGVGKMGTAHVAYWAWQRLRELNRSAPAVEMAERSFDAAEQAMEMFLPGSLAWAFALNHCVYIGTVAHVRMPRTEELRRELINVNPRHDHYRFADTRARQHTEELSALISQHRIENILQNPEFQDDLCTLLQQAQRVLKASGPFFGDEEVGRHHDELETYRTSLRCRGRTVKGTGAAKREAPTAELPSTAESA